MCARSWEFAVEIFKIIKILTEVEVGVKLQLVKEAERV